MAKQKSGLSPLEGYVVANLNRGFNSRRDNPGASNVLTPPEGDANKAIPMGGLDSRSPIGPNHTLTPKRLKPKEAEALFTKLDKKLTPLVSMRSRLNKVYSDGYFENHYKVADADMKKGLHEQTMVAHSRLTDNEDSKKG